MVEKLKIGFIGFGRVVEWQIKQLEGLDHSIEFVCDVSPDKLKRASEIVPRAKLFNDLEDVLRDNRLFQFMAVVIATPSGTHYEIAQKLASNKDWKIVIEKPTFLSPNHFLKAQKWKNSDNIIPIFQNRYNKSVVKALEIIQQKLIGEILYSSLKLEWTRPQRYYNLADWRGTWANDGGVSTNQGIHYFDITRHLLGGFNNVIAKMRRLAVDIQCEDYINAFFVMQSGIPLDVRMTTAIRHPEEEACLTINGTKGSLKLYGVCCNKLELTLGLGDKEVILGSGNKIYSGEEVEMPYGYGHRTLYKILLGTEENKELSLPTLSESFQTMQFIYSCYSSAISGKESYPELEYKQVPLGSNITEKINFAE